LLLAVDITHSDIHCLVPYNSGLIPPLVSIIYMFSCYIPLYIIFLYAEMQSTTFQWEHVSVHCILHVQVTLLKLQRLIL
jgi:hypothetical protein